MTRDEIRSAFVADLIAIAPDIDPATLGDDDHLQDDLGLDSMDFLNLVAALHRRFSLPIPEDHYQRLATPGQATDYLEQELAGR